MVLVVYPAPGASWEPFKTTQMNFMAKLYQHDVNLYVMLLIVMSICTFQAVEKKTVYALKMNRLYLFSLYFFMSDLWGNKLHMFENTTKAKDEMMVKGVQQRITGD